MTIFILSIEDIWRNGKGKVGMSFDVFLFFYPLRLHPLNCSYSKTNPIERVLVWTSYVFAKYWPQVSTPPPVSKPSHSLHNNWAPMCLNWTDDDPKAINTPTATTHNFALIIRHCLLHFLNHLPSTLLNHRESTARGAPQSSWKLLFKGDWNDRPSKACHQATNLTKSLLLGDCG